ncbi:MAG: thiamine phosphate synthase [Betaproteobacteria bacterium]|nr:thiamine phosphate synthase [Betaproteobacteria bacterium]
MSIDQSIIRGLYAITPEIADTRRLLSQVQQAIDGGTTLLQYRAKTLTPTVRQAQAQALATLCQPQGVALIVNDDIDLARSCQAAGVHLGRGDKSIQDIYSSDSDHSLLVGISCYDSLPLALAAEKAGASYVAFGSFFSSRTKPAAVRASLSLLQEARQHLGIPIVAIGGITPGHVDALIEAGADAVAVISALFEAPDIAETARQFNHHFQGRYVQFQRPSV